MASLVLAIGLSAPANAQQDSSREQMVDMVLQIQQLQDEVRTLTGQLEEQAHLIETLRQRQRDQYLDLDQRIGELSGLRADGIGVTNRHRQLSIFRRRKTCRNSGRKTAKHHRSLAWRHHRLLRESVAASPEAEKQAYDKAFQALKELRYADAAEEFHGFLQMYPNSEYADNAQYWLGESYYVTRNYDMALESFQSLMNDYPQSLKVPDSLLKVGYTHYELKQWELARAALAQVQEQYPNTTVARLAENRLRSMRVEGHF